MKVDEKLPKTLSHAFTRDTFRLQDCSNEWSNFLYAQSGETVAGAAVEIIN